MFSKERALFQQSKCASSVRSGAPFNFQLSIQHYSYSDELEAVVTQGCGPAKLTPAIKGELFCHIQMVISSSKRPLFTKALVTASTIKLIVHFPDFVSRVGY